VLLAKHAQHVALVHFPIALFLVGTLFDWAARTWRRSDLASAAYFNLLAAAVSVPVVIATGIAAWQWQLEGARLHGTLLFHLALACVSGVLICAVGWIRFRSRGKNVDARPNLLPLEAVTTALIMITAHLGGILSGVNLPGT
jgi:uncharacterized membrane protein